MKTLLTIIILLSLLAINEFFTSCVTKMYVSEVIELPNHKAKFVFQPVDSKKSWNCSNYENSIDADDTAFKLNEIVKMNSLGEILKLKK